MKLKVLSSGSKGNSYILENDKEALLIEAGVPFKEVLRHVNHRKIVGCLVSHEHQDHSKYLTQYINYGITYIENNSMYNKPEKIGSFIIKSFKNHHDVTCFGYHIYHPDMGILVFSTDTNYISYRLKDVNHWLIECNHSKEILNKSVKEGFSPVLADRIFSTHMSLDTCKEFLKANDLSKTRNIVLLHLSDSNSNEEQFQREIHELTKKTTYIADKGLEIDISLFPF
ncbi:MAG: MBL fold metallo-hydrolase [Cellulosilyticaceae bacterium]